MAMFRRGFMAIALAGAIAALAGCSTYSKQALGIRAALFHDDYEKAIAEVEEINRSTSELLYCYELGMVLHEQGDYAASNLSFERAEQVFEELYTKSISREVGAALVNEGIAKYRGDAFEAVMVNYYKILNYLFLGKTSDALVECRRVNFKLQLIHDAGETYFVDDPFMQYLTALVYEMGGEASSAEVSYRAATQEYERDATLPPPPWLPCDAASNARMLGDATLAASYTKDQPCDTPAGAGRVAVLVETGAVARKIETGFTVPIFENDRFDDQDEFCHELYGRRGMQYNRSVRIKYWLRVALPALQVDPPMPLRAVVRASLLTSEREPAATNANAVCVENLDAQATRAYTEKEPTVVLRAIARALAKYLASSAAGKKDEGLGALVNLLGVVTETADTRSWTTLPRSVDLARLDLAPGRYRLDVDVLDAHGTLVVHRSFDDVEVRAGGLEVRRVRLR